MSKPAISVIIPAYNEEKFLPKLLASLKKQTFSLPYEIIVVDNNSSDKTAAIARQFGARVLHEKKQGYASTCNAGFYQAKADIIARADADYIVTPSWLQTIWDFFKENPTYIAVGGPVYPLENDWWQNLIFYPFALGWMYMQKIFHQGFLLPNIAVRKQSFLKIGGFNTKITFGEDQDICYRLCKAGKVSLNLRMYVYTSMRRIYDMGLLRYVLDYTIANQIAMKKGEKIKFGINPVRTTPNKPVHITNPWMYLLPLPLALCGIAIRIAFLFPPSSQQHVLTLLLQFLQK